MIVASVDVETTKVPRHRPWSPGSYLVAVGMAWEDGRTRTWVFNHTQMDPVPQRDMIQQIQEEVNTTGLLVGHNLKFDLQWLRHIGVVVDHVRHYCTQVSEYLLKGQRKISYHLNDLCTRYKVTNKHDKVKMYWEAGYETDQVPLDTLLPYLEQDCVSALAIYQIQIGLVKQAKMLPIVFLQMQLMTILSEMESNGILIDPAKAEGFIKEYEEQLEKIERDLKILLGRTDLNLHSGYELSAALYGGVIKRPKPEVYVTTRNTKLRESYVFHYKNDIKPPVVKWRTRTVPELITKTRNGVEEITLPKIFEPVKGSSVQKTGYFSVDKNTLSQLKARTKAQKEIIELLEALSKSSKILETFRGKAEGSGILGKLDAQNIVHPSYNQTVTATGRLSSSDPNGQNLPRKGTSPIKRVIIPRYDLIGNADASQLEWRAAAILSGDPAAIHEIISGADYHRENAIQFFGANPDLPNHDPKFEPLRTAAKIFGFRLLYGGTAFGMYMDHTMPRFNLKRWQEIVEQYQEKYKGITQWQQKNIDLVHSNGGWMRNPTGRLLTFTPFIQPNSDGYLFSPRMIKNYPVQSFATADIVPLAMVMVWKQMKKENLKSLMIMQVHDSIVFDLLKKEVDRVADICSSVFNNLSKHLEKYFGMKINVPLAGEFEIGPNYGELKQIR
jgi:DNA polymerase I-like protein with 3'-5' exonuclease and polymerase domains